MTAHGDIAGCTTTSSDRYLAVFSSSFLNKQKFSSINCFRSALMYFGATNNFRALATLLETAVGQCFVVENLKYFSVRSSYVTVNFFQIDRNFDSVRKPSLSQ